ncbi:hypothetical protein HMN09_00201200 [Mycena chlorophos]|uniref:Uncharacterized protein n=1 Tax=Mycena chlorophos TaxID=658473 RepID=A0A8H6TQV1_MYCCL|nr:hypothetical protein HMN09_00201200 [Mycena chlorophos]
MSAVQDWLLPPELIELIVDKLRHDNITLKSCSLAASFFREPCQRRLLHALNLCTTSVYRRQPYSKVSARLDESPHLASYITKVVVYLPATDVEWERNRDIAKSVFRRLAHIRDATIQGNYSHQARYESLSVEVVDWTISTLRVHAVLDHLRLWSIERLPVSVLAGALAAAPSISFRDVRLLDDSEDPPANLDLQPGRVSLDRLAIWHSPMVNALLLRPTCAVYTDTLRALILCEEYLISYRETMFALCFTTARRLEHLDLEFATRIRQESNINLPNYLPRLRSLVVRFSNNGLSTWVAPTFLLKLVSHETSPALKSLTLCVSTVVAADDSEEEKSRYTFSDSQAITELDRVLGLHCTPVAVRFSLSTLPLGQKQGVRNAVFAVALRKAMPNAERRCLLEVD